MPWPNQLWPVCESRQWGAMKYSLIALSALALAGCQTTDPAPAPTPSAQSVVAPSTEVPHRYAAFSGVWKGSWDVANSPLLDGNIAIQTISPSGHVTALYAVGDAARGQFEAHSFMVAGDIKGGTLTLDRFPNGARVSYTLLPDGTLRGRYLRDGTVTPGRFEKVRANGQ